MCVSPTNASSHHKHVLVMIVYLLGWSCLEHDSVVRFKSMDTTAVNSPHDDDDALFSQYIRSPSPDGRPTDIASDDIAQSVIDIDDFDILAMTNRKPKPFSFLKQR